MKRTISRLVFILALAAVPCGATAQASTALIFGGDGTENDEPGGTLNAAVNAARAAGFKTVVVKDLLQQNTLDQADVWIQPGGPNFDQAADMQKTGVFEQVKKFVASGGGYVGFCGGGYMAQSGGTVGLGLLPGNAQHQDEPTQKTKVMWNGKLRYMHFEYGPQFQTGPGIEVFATYVSNGAPAAVRGIYGKGHVILSGPHPEALDTWEPVGDPDGSDIFLAVEMIRWATRDRWKPADLSSDFFAY